MIVYVVHRVGMYEQGVFGIFTQLERAKEVVKYLAENDCDSYHEYVVYEAEIDSITIPVEKAGGRGNYVPPFFSDYRQVICTIKK